MPPYLYSTFHAFVVSILYLNTIKLFDKSNLYLFYKPDYKFYSVWLYMLFLIFFIGLRPIDKAFSDTVGYAIEYKKLQSSGMFYIDKNRTEWLWAYFEYYCSKVFDIHVFFLIVFFFYLIPILVGLKIIIGRYTSLALLFVLSSFSFFAYATNTIRSGVALSLVFMSLGFICGKKKKYILFLVINFLAYNIHHSSLLPICCSIISLFLNLKLKYFIYIWFTCVILSSFVGDSFQAYIMMNFGFDPRMKELAYATTDLSTFSRIGFRWDFLLYSFAPILLGWYIVIKKKKDDGIYSFLLKVYVLSNSFWVLVNRVQFSDRIAYLSWFIYPLVLSYPLLKIRFIENKQYKFLFYILGTQILFLLFMNVVYYGI